MFLQVVSEKVWTIDKHAEPLQDYYKISKLIYSGSFTLVPIINFRLIHRRIVRYYQLPIETTIMIMSVEENSAAEKAGLMKGDLLIEFNGHYIKGIDYLHKQLTGEMVDVKISGYRQFIVLPISVLHLSPV